MTYADHDRAARHHREHATAHEIAADLAAERDDTAGAAEHRAAHDFHLGAAHHHEVQATHARLCFAEIPAANLPTHEAAFT